MSNGNQSGAWHQQQQHDRRTAQEKADFHFGKNGQPGFWQATEGGPGTNAGQARQNGQRHNGGQQNGSQGRTYSPLADPEFFTNSDVRNYCENGRAAMQMLGFDIAMAAEVMEAVLKEIPDPEGRPWGSKLRARRVAKRLAKTADHLTGAAKNFAATYAAFQREFSPELEPMRQRQARAPRRTFDFNS